MKRSVCRKVLPPGCSFRVNSDGMIFCFVTVLSKMLRDPYSQLHGSHSNESSKHRNCEHVLGLIWMKPLIL